jgi:hypothetical protein
MIRTNKRVSAHLAATAAKLAPITAAINRGLGTDSADVHFERLPDGRVRAHLLRPPGGAPGAVANLICNGGRGGTLFVRSTGLVEVQILAKNPDAILTDNIWIFAPISQFIGTNLQTGTVISLGPFNAGAELIFGIKVHDEVTSSPHGDFIYQMGPGSRNSDGLVHDEVDCGAGDIAIVGIEDLYGDSLSGTPGVPGDGSFNDARIQVSLL